ncbi:MAG: SAM-dependent methyltransferase [Gemmatimonadetes bacterium]|nr:MAG: SAM-dependent methyltransferase [Gemmatimonadota bacterium]
MTPAYVQRLRCPRCEARLAFDGTLRGAELDTGTLRCRGCGVAWPVQRGLPDLVDGLEIRGFERLIRQVYDLIAPFHDLAVRYVLPLAMFCSEEEGRARYVRRLELEQLHADRGERVNILDVGIGGGGNLPVIARCLSDDVEAEIWGVDFSANMLAQCVRRCRHWKGPPVHLLLGDAHRLPFPDASFDRVLHVGGIATYRDPRRALAEMARVARPDTPIVVVDEQLDPAAARSWYQWLTFKAMTLYELSPHAPVEHLPPDAYDVRVEQASSFFYCLTFRVPRSVRERAAAAGPEVRQP